jgi:ribosomal protein L23
MRSTTRAAISDAFAALFGAAPEKIAIPDFKNQPERGALLFDFGEER